jgi:hypothetical protein
LFSVAFETSTAASYVEIRFNTHFEAAAHLRSLGIKNCKVVPQQIMDPGGRSFVANDGEDFVLGVRTQLLSTA